MRREKEIEERKAERRRGVIKAGGAITWSQGNAHATGRCILRQPVKVLVPFLATPQQLSMQRHMIPMVVNQLSCITITSR